MAQGLDPLQTGAALFVQVQKAVQVQVQAPVAQGLAEPLRMLSHQLDIEHQDSYFLVRFQKTPPKASAGKETGVAKRFGTLV
jgi:hypothetical protein